MKRTFGRSNDVQAVGTFPLGVWHLVEKVGPVRHTEARRKAWYKGTCRKVCSLGVWKPVEGMHSFRRWQKTPQWGPIAWIRGRAARNRHDGAFSRADILRLSFRKITCPGLLLNLVTPFGLLRAFPSVMRSAERPPCRVFCHLGLETLHSFLVMRFGVRCLRQEIGAVLNITCSMAVSSKSGNTKLVADALQRELSYAGVRFATFIDLDDADAEPAQSEGVKGAENVEGAEGDEAVEDGQSANAAASTIATQASEADVVFVGFWCDKGSCSPAVQHFLQGLAGKRVFLFGTCGFGESDEYFAQILERVRAYLPVDAQYIGGAMCQGKMGMGVKRRYEGMLEKDPENAQACMLIDNWNKAQSHPNEDDVSRIAAAAKEALEGIAE